MDKSLMPTKKPLTEEDIKWCNELLAKAEPYSGERAKYFTLDAPIGELDFDREMATMAKEMLEKGWKY